MRRGSHPYVQEKWESMELCLGLDDEPLKSSELVGTTWVVLWRVL